MTPFENTPASAFDVTASHFSSTKPNGKRVLVISPHPDDESIGCGGVLSKHIHEGGEAIVIFLTSGEKGGHGRPFDETARLREGEAHCAAQILGIQEIDFWREPDGAFEATDSLTERLSKKIEQWRPDSIYVPHANEMHPDHRAAAQLVSRALQTQPERRPEVLMYEVWTPIQQLDEIVDISPFIKAKLCAVQAYQSQCEVLDFVEAVRGLNRYRGEMHSWPEGDYAEVFTRMRL